MTVYVLCLDSMLGRRHKEIEDKARVVATKVSVINLQSKTLNLS